MIKIKTDIRKDKKEEGKLIPLNFNYVFTGIFNDENNIDIVDSFLALYLNKPLEEIKGNVEIKSRDIPINSKKEKNKQIDLLLELKEEVINIELSNSGGQRIIDRDVVYISKIHGNQLKYGDNRYEKIIRTLQIRLNNYHSNDNKLIETYYLRNDNDKILTKKLQIDIVDLVNAKKNVYNENEERIAKFCKAMLLEDEKEIRKEIRDIMGEKVSNKLIGEMKKYSNDEEVVNMYSAYTREELERNTMLEEAREEAIEQGLEQGVSKRNIEIAKKMLEDNIDIQTIIKYTDLTEEEIKQIK